MYNSIDTCTLITSMVYNIHERLLYGHDTADEKDSTASSEVNHGWIFYGATCQLKQIFATRSRRSKVILIFLGIF